MQKLELEELLTGGQEVVFGRILGLSRELKGTGSTAIAA